MAAGFDPAAFWSLTPGLYAVHMAGAGRRLEREARDTSWAVWHVAALTRTAKFPRFKDFVPGTPAAGSPAPVPWQAQMAKWQAYAAARGKNS